MCCCAVQPAGSRSSRRAAAATWPVVTGSCPRLRKAVAAARAPTAAGAAAAASAAPWPGGSASCAPPPFRRCHSMAWGSVSQRDSGAWPRSRKCQATPPAVHLTSPGLLFPRVQSRPAPRSACSRGLEASVLSPDWSVSTAAAPHATSGAGYWKHLPVSGTLMRRQMRRDPAGLPPRWALGTFASPPN